MISMKLTSLITILAGVLSACASQPRTDSGSAPIKANAKAAVVAHESAVDATKIGMADLGGSHCLGPANAFRGQVRDVAIGTGWTAFEDQPGGKNTRCDAGPFSAEYLVASPCSTSGDPEILSKNGTDRIAITQVAGGAFQVQFKHKDGSVYLKFAVTADAVPAKRARWLKNSAPVQWVDGSGNTFTYDVFVYVVDDPLATLAIPKRFHVEFYNRALPACIAEEPTATGMLQDVDAGKICSIASKANKQTPVGDGGTHGPNAATGECVYN